MAHFEANYSFTIFNFRIFHLPANIGKNFLKKMDIYEFDPHQKNKLMTLLTQSLEYV